MGKFTQQDFENISNLSEILAGDDELTKEDLPCKFELGNLKIEIFNLEKEIIK